MRGLGWLAAVSMLSSLNAADLFDKVKPILTTRCAACHGNGARLSDFDLTTRAGLLAGGKHGVDLIPGNAAASRLYQWVAAGKMPPDRKLDDPDVETIRQWIDSGAPWGPDASIAVQRPRAGLDWWALQPPQKSPVPKIPGAAHPIDAFLLQRLREKSLDYSPPADPRTLARRLSFDLTGLPPAPDLEKLPYEQQVERLLASPHYGERWGRHWLDIVRFGETDGGEHNNERFNAWRYRDYVIDAFHSDKPYNRFILEQLAGDLLAPADPKIAAATGFLVAGPWDSVTKRQNKDEVLRKTIRMDELDDMVTTTFATFQALTVNCARCHDHKFDPIPTRDYYRLTAVFNGAGFGEKVMAGEEEQKAREAALEPLQREAGKIRQALNQIEAPVRTRLLLEKYRAFDEKRRNERQRIPLNPIFNRNQFAPVKASHFRFAVMGSNGRPRIDRLELLPAGRVFSNLSASPGSPDNPSYITVHLAEPVEVSEIVWSSDRGNGAAAGVIRIYRFEYSTDGQTWTAACSSIDHIDFLEIGLPQISEQELTAHLSSEDLRKRAEWLARQQAVTAKIAAVPELTAVYGVIREPGTPTPSHVLERGSPATPGEEVTPGALSAVRALPPDLAFDPGNEGSRRLALARWIADDKNPLTARVIVNRVWQYHFGSGIVNTPSDFGFNGDRPSHPELLDYLAVSFIENGWSLKWLHRQILLSRAYRQSSRFNEKAHAVDAANHLLWRMPLKRMDAETLRDSILHVTGNLNPQAGGPGFFLQKKVDRASYIHKAVDYDGPELWRRAVYRFVVRGGERIFMDSFDCPDPAVATPQRSSTNTPVQALTLLNNAFVFRQSELLAERLKKETGGQPADMIARAYSLLFGRKPNDRELSAGLRFLSTQPLAMYCRALFNTNEFVYVP